MHLVALVLERHPVLGDVTIPLSRKYNVAEKSRVRAKKRGTFIDIEVKEEARDQKNHMNGFGDIVCLVGSNGVGKSCTLRVLFELYNIKISGKVPNYNYSIVYSSTSGEYSTFSKSISVNINKKNTTKCNNPIGKIYTFHQTGNDTFPYSKDESGAVFFEKQLSENYMQLLSHFSSIFNDKENVSRFKEFIPPKFLWFLDVQLEYFHEQEIYNKTLGKRKAHNNRNIALVVEKLKKENLLNVEYESDQITTTLGQRNVLRSIVKSYDFSKCDFGSNMKLHSFILSKVAAGKSLTIFSNISDVDKNENTSFESKIALLCLLSRDLCNEFILERYYRKETEDNNSAYPYFGQFIDKYLPREVLNYLDSFNRKILFKEFDFGKQGFFEGGLRETIESIYINDVIDTYNYVEARIHLPFASSGQLFFVNFLSYLLNAIKSHESDDPLFVLVDEPDSFLHLDWQRKFSAVLDSFVSSIDLNCNFVHFVFATHSPFLLGDLLEECVVYFNKQQGDTLKVQKNLKNKVFLQNLHKICIDSFFMERTKGDYALSYLNRIKTKLNNFNPKKNDYEEISSLIEVVGEDALKSTLFTVLDAKARKYLSKDRKIYAELLKRLRSE